MPDNVLVMPPLDSRLYTTAKGVWVAEAYARGERLRDIHLGAPDQIPPPLYINRWRRDVPAFDLLMREAECARAAELIEDALAIVDDPERLAAQARNAFDARRFLAGALDSAKFGTRGGESGGVTVNVNLATVDDATLVSIAMQDRRRLGQDAGEGDALLQLGRDAEGAG